MSWHHKNKICEIVRLVGISRKNKMKNPPPTPAKNLPVSVDLWEKCCYASMTSYKSFLTLILWRGGWVDPCPPPSKSTHDEFHCDQYCASPSLGSFLLVTLCKVLSTLHNLYITSHKVIWGVQSSKVTAFLIFVFILFCFFVCLFIFLNFATQLESILLRSTSNQPWMFRKWRMYRPALIF